MSQQSQAVEAQRRRLESSQGIVDITRGHALYDSMVAGIEFPVLEPLKWRKLTHPSAVEVDKRALDSALRPEDLLSALASRDRLRVLEAICVIHEWEACCGESLWDKLPEAQVVAVTRRLVALSDRHSDSEIRSQAACSAYLILDDRKDDNSSRDRTR